MPTNYSAIYFGFVALIDGGVDAEKPHNAFRSYTVEVPGDAMKMIDGIYVPANGDDTIKGCLKHYVQAGTAAPNVSAVTFTSGTFSVSQQDTDGMPCLELQSFSAVDVKGDVDSTEYMEHCPDPAPLQVSVVGIADKPIEPPFEADTKLKGFHLQSYVYKSAEEKSVSLKLVCLFPFQKRWSHTALPKRGALVSVTGQIIGVHYETKCFAVLVQGFNYINPAGTEAATRSSQPELSSESPQTSTPAVSRWAKKRPADSPLTGRSKVKQEDTDEVVQVPTTPTATQPVQPQSSPAGVAASTPSKKGKEAEVISLDELDAPVSTQRSRWTKPVTVMSGSSTLPASSSASGRKRSVQAASQKPVRGRVSALLESDTADAESEDEL